MDESHAFSFIFFHFTMTTRENMCMSYLLGSCCELNKFISHFFLFSFARVCMPSCPRGRWIYNFRTHSNFIIGFSATRTQFNFPTAKAFVFVRAILDADKYYRSLWQRYRCLEYVVGCRLAASLCLNALKRPTKWRQRQKSDESNLKLQTVFR